MKIGIKLFGDKETAASLNRMGDKVVPTIRDSTKKAVLYVHQEMPPYPPEPAGSEYVRTGTAGRAITTFGVGSVAGGAQSLSEVKPLFDGAQGIVGGAVDYLPYLIDEEEQADVHLLNGWFTLQDVIRKARDAITDIYRKAIKELVNG